MKKPKTQKIDPCEYAEIETYEDAVEIMKMIRELTKERQDGEAPKEPNSKKENKA